MFPYCLDTPNPMAIPLSPLQLTYVLYPSHQPYLKYLALASLLPYFLFTAQCTLIFARWREPIWLKFVLGQLGNEMINMVLKWIIHEPRPISHLGTGFGMPSSHSHPKSLVLGISSIALFLTLLVGYSRFQLKYHTEYQVFIGFFVGAMVAWMWHRFVLFEYSLESLQSLFYKIDKGRSNYNKSE